MSQALNHCPVSVIPTVWPWMTARITPPPWFCIALKFFKHLLRYEDATQFRPNFFRKENQRQHFVFMKESHLSLMDLTESRDVSVTGEMGLGLNDICSAGDTWAKPSANSDYPLGNPVASVLSPPSTVSRP